MQELGIAIDGGKDSLSMAVKNKTQSGSYEVIKSPGTLVVSAYAPVPDVRVKVTPELTSTSSHFLIHIDMSGREGSARTGGSALAQVFSQIGDRAPDVDDSRHLLRGFADVQKMIRNRVCTAGHDISDGGLITCLLEMAFCSNVGLSLSLDIPAGDEPISYLFAEECGVVIEVSGAKLDEAKAMLKQANLKHQVVGKSLVDEDRVSLVVNGTRLIDVSVLSSDGVQYMITFFRRRK